MASRVSAQFISPRLYLDNGSIAISADSKAMDIPLPVTGGIIVTASPMQHSVLSMARCGFSESPATEQNESSSNRADASRSRNGESGLPRSNSNPDSRVSPG